jgi:hypothetical protein
MAYIAAALFGASAGLLLAFGTPPRRWSGLQFGAAVVVFLTGVATAVWELNTPSGVVAVLIVAAFASLLLGGGLAWADHPLLAGAGYWSRVWTVLFNQSRLRQSWRQSVAPSESTETSLPG